MFDVNHPPDAFRTMPDQAVLIATRIANDHISAYPSEEDQAIIMAILAVEQMGYHHTADGWVENRTPGQAMFRDVVYNAALIGEDEHYFHYSINMTSPGVHNHFRKRPDEVRKIPGQVEWNWGDILPAFNDHPSDPYDISQMKGYVSNIELDDDGNTVKITATDHVPKSDTETNRKLQNGEITAGSIFAWCYRDRTKTGVQDGEEYVADEEDIRFVHWARMDDQKEANREAIYNSKYNAPTKGGNSLTEEKKDSKGEEEEQKGTEGEAKGTAGGDPPVTPPEPKKDEGKAGEEDESEDEKSEGTPANMPEGLGEAVKNAVTEALKPIVERMDVLENKGKDDEDKGSKLAPELQEIVNEHNEAIENKTKTEVAEIMNNTGKLFTETELRKPTRETVQKALAAGRALAPVGNAGPEDKIRYYDQEKKEMVEGRMGVK